MHIITGLESLVPRDTVCVLTTSDEARVMLYAGRFRMSFISSANSVILKCVLCVCDMWMKPSPPNVHFYIGCHVLCAVDYYSLCQFLLC